MQPVKGHLKRSLLGPNPTPVAPPPRIQRHRTPNPAQGGQDMQADPDAFVGERVAPGGAAPMRHRAAHMARALPAPKDWILGIGGTSLCYVRGPTERVVVCFRTSTVSHTWNDGETHEEIVSFADLPDAWEAMLDRARIALEREQSIAELTFDIRENVVHRRVTPTGWTATRAT